MNRLHIKGTVAVVLLLILLLPPTPARGQDVGGYRVGRGRRIGGITLPTPPFNPHAGILGDRKRRGRDSLKPAPRRVTRRSVGAANGNPARRVTRKRVK